MHLEMWSPKPIPPVLISRVASRKPNSLNNFNWSSCFIPTPVSSTAILISLYAACCWTRVHLIVTDPPDGVNLRALLWKFIKTCWSRCMSVHIKWPFGYPSNPMNKLVKLIFNSIAFYFWMSIISLTASRTSKLLQSFRNLPSLICARHSISFTNKFNSFEDACMISLHSRSSLNMILSLSLH